MNRLSHKTEIFNQLKEWNLLLYLTKPQMNHFVTMMDGMITEGFSGKISQATRFSYHDKHRTSLGRFLQTSPWNEKHIAKIYEEKVEKQIHRIAQRSTKPIFLSIDDTICKKTKPLSQVKNPIEACDFHFSHKEGKSLWGHQIVSSTVTCHGTSYPYEFERYDKQEKISKIKLAQDMIRKYPSTEQKTYVLCDTWYTCKDLIQTALQKGFHVIGALKTNRIIYPCGIYQQAKEFATYIHPEETDLVTIGTKTYRVYRYEGSLKDIENAVVLFSWDIEVEMAPSNMKCFLSTDTEITNEQILNYYGNRWTIETYFKQVKEKLGFEGYQIRHQKAIRRFWTMINFTFVFSVFLTNQSFCEAVHLIRKKKQNSLIEFVYVQTKNGETLEKIKKSLKIA